VQGGKDDADSYPRGVASALLEYQVHVLQKQVEVLESEVRAFPQVVEDKLAENNERVAQSRRWSTERLLQAIAAGGALIAAFGALMKH
jgi:hypothetical protein